MATNEPLLEVFSLSGSLYGWRVLLTLEAKGMDYDVHYLRASEGETRTPEYLAINPRGKVPTLRDGDNIICESLAIMAYLDRKHPDPPLYGMTPTQAGHIWQRILEFENYANEPMRRIILPLYFDAAESRADEIRAACEPVHKELTLLETVLRSASWLCYDALSAADFAIYPAIKSLERAVSKPAARDFDLNMLPIRERYPGIGVWVARIEALPYYQRTYPSHW